MPLGEIKHNIDEQAKKEARGIHDDAEAQKESILNEASSKAKEITQRAERELGEELKRLAEENESSIGLAAKNVMLGAREEAVDAEVSRIKRLLISGIRKSEHYDRIFKEALKQAKGIAPADELVIAVAKRDRPKVEKFGAKVETQGISGGLMVRTRNGDTEIDATLDKIIDSKIDSLRSLVLGDMFGEEKRPKPAPNAKAEPRRAKAKKAEQAKARTAKKTKK